MRNANPQLAVSPTDQPWGAALLAYTRNHGQATCRYTVIEERQLFQEPVDLFVTDAGFSRLDARLVQRLHTLHTRIIAVADPAESHRSTELLRWGVDEIITTTGDTTIDVDAIIFAAISLVEAARLDGSLPEITGRAPDEPPHGAPTPGAQKAATPGQPAATPGRRQRGIIYAVSGPSGGCGATEIAIGLAAAISQRGESVVVFDADDITPAVLQRLSLSENAPNVRRAVLAINRDPTSFEQTISSHREGGFAILPGLPHARDWRHITAEDTKAVIAELAARFAHVVVNIGHQLERVELDDFRERYGMTRSVPAVADTVVGVGTPTGVPNLLDWVEQITDLTGARVPVQLVINQIDSRDRTFYEAEITAEIEHTFRPAGIWYVPFDHRVRRAAWDGTTVRSGPFVSALARVAEGVCPRMTATPTKPGLAAASAKKWTLPAFVRRPTLTTGMGTAGLNAGAEST